MVNGIDFAVTIARNDAETSAFEPLDLPFDHPLWIVYSSGTTGLPKLIVHGHGGTVVVALPFMPTVKKRVWTWQPVATSPACALWAAPARP